MRYAGHVSPQAVDQTVLGAVEHAPYRPRSASERVDVKSWNSVALRLSCRAKACAHYLRLMMHCISFVTSSSVRQCRQTHRRGGSEHPKLQHSTTRLGRNSCSARTLRDHHRKRPSTATPAYPDSWSFTYGHALRC